MPATPKLSDEVVAQYRAIATVDWPFLTIADEQAGEDVPYPIQAFLAIRSWHDAAVLSASAADGASAATDNQGFRFRADGRVAVFNALDDTVIVSRSAFTALLLRLLDVLVLAATEGDDPVVGSTDWTSVINARDSLRERKA